MTLAWIYLRAHERYGMLEPIQEKMQIEERDYVCVVPGPDYIAGSCFNRLRSNITRHSELREVGVAHSVSLQKLSKVTFAKFRTVHAHRILPNIHKRSYPVRLKRCHYLFGLSAGVTNCEEIGSFG